ncbi:hypothetical protein CAOG_09203 [Capsaspora owczarzaki ATCC 30864]|uniref:hypothetical protein n=1 Tax=Capsaspora owczarzaki (strain ATCC 30864) TaxID=595528 RepID=UPI0003526CA7|nr:hypothetical protein CAOG_09203 [Capsaspora owczarzaki ATCC 30864]|eukprot:XP_011270920.1 hypothetical protein CAOG_09203 [Capsaspora owczarzaki ATCC 30864]
MGKNRRAPPALPAAASKRQAEDPSEGQSKRARTEDNDKSETTNDVAPMDTSNATSGASSSSSSSSSRAAPLSELEMISALPEQLRICFKNVKWTAPDLSNHLLKELFNYRVFIADEPGDDTVLCSRG